MKTKPSKTHDNQISGIDASLATETVKKTATTENPKAASIEIQMRESFTVARSYRSPAKIRAKSTASMFIYWPNKVIIPRRGCWHIQIPDEPESGHFPSRQNI